MSEIVDRKRDRALAGIDPNYVTFVVGGRHFSIDVEDIEAFPDSYFSAALKKEWCAASSNVVNIDRSGGLFRHVVYFHAFRKLNPHTRPLCIETIKELKFEADFYNMPELFNACDALVIEQWKLHQYVVGNVECCGRSKDPSHLVNQLSFFWEPLYLKSELYHLDASFWRLKIHKTSRLAQLNMTELLQDASMTPFGRCLPARMLNHSFLSGFKSLNHNMHNNQNFWFKEVHCMQPRHAVEVRPLRLTIVQSGESLIVDTQRAAQTAPVQYIGTFILNLNSAFTGGKVDAYYPESNQTVSQTRANQWIAVRDGCTITTHPVTCGTQLVLLAEIVALCILPADVVCSEPLRLFNVACEADSVLRAPVEAIGGEGRNGAPLFDDRVLNGAFVVHNAEDYDDIPMMSYRNQRLVYPNTLQGVLRPVDRNSSTVQKILVALDEELQHFDDVVICLSQLYSLYDVDGADLVGCDAVLYDTLSHVCDPKSCVVSTGSASVSAYITSFVLVVVSTMLDISGSTRFDSEGFIPDLSFGTASSGAKRTTKLVLPINASSDEEGIANIQTHANAQMIENEVFLTALRVTKTITGF